MSLISLFSLHTKKVVNTTS